LFPATRFLSRLDDVSHFPFFPCRTWARGAFCPLSCLGSRFETRWEACCSSSVGACLSGVFMARDFEGLLAFFHFYLAKIVCPLTRFFFSLFGFSFCLQARGISFFFGCFEEHFFSFLFPCLSLGQLTAVSLFHCLFFVAWVFVFWVVLALCVVFFFLHLLLACVPHVTFFHCISLVTSVLWTPFFFFTPLSTTQVLFFFPSPFLGGGACLMGL